MYKKAFELSYKNKKVEIEIQDFTGTVRNINGAEDLFSLSYISDSKDKGQSILVTEADINFYADDYFNIDELKTVGETDIKVKYYEDDNLHWSGFVIPDFFSTSVDTAPVVSMVATDRIGTLKEVSNNAESNIPIQILASCLKQTGQDLPINLIADNNHFETPIQLERIEEIASYDVIRTFMVLFNCKITLYKNAWWIINKKLLESGFVNYKSYNSNGVGGSVTPFAQPILDIDLVDRDGQREIKPTASEISLFLEFGGSKKYPKNWNFEELNKTAKLFDSWSNHAGFEQGWRDKRILFYVYDSGYYNAWFTDEDTDKISLWYRAYWYKNKISDNILDYPNLKSSSVNVPKEKGFIDIALNGNFTTRDGMPIWIVPLIHNKTNGNYFTYNKEGVILKIGSGTPNLNQSNFDYVHNPRASSQAGFNPDDFTHEVVDVNWDIKNTFDLRDFGSDSDEIEMQVVFLGGIYSQGSLDYGTDVFLNSVNISFNDSQVTGKGLIFKVKQGGEKFSKSRDPETILFSDKINQGVNGYFYNYKYDDTSIVDLPSEFALSSVRERADMFSKARDYYSLDGNFIVNPLAKYTCGLKSFVLVGGENRREDASIIVEEIVSNTLNRTDFIYTYFDDGKDKVKSIGTASGGSSSGGGGGSSPSTPQLIKVDEEGNYYSEQPFYSLGGLSAFGFSEVGDGNGGGGIINVIDNLTSTSKTDPLSANMGRYLKTLIDNIEVGEGGQVLVDWEAITGKPTTFVPSAHTHIIGDVTGLQGALDNKASLAQLDDKEDAFTKNSAFNKNFGTGLNDVARGNHTHAFASLTSIPTTLAGYGITDGANKVHTHSISDVTNLQTELNKKATNTALTTHVNKTDNPHSVTKSQVGLGNVANKDLSNVDNIQQATKTEFTSHKNLFDSMFRKVGTNIEAKLSLYSLGGLSAYGFSEEGSEGGGGIVNILPSWANYTTDKSGWALSAGLGVDLNTRKADKTWVESLLEDYVPTDTKYTAGRGLTLTGTQFSTSFDIANYATVTALGGKVDKVTGKSLISDVEITRLAGVTNQTRASLNITNVDNTSDANKPISNATQTALNSKLATSIFNTHNNDNVRHITGAERTKWDGVVTDFAGLEIGGRNLLLNSKREVILTSGYASSQFETILEAGTYTYSLKQKGTGFIYIYYDGTSKNYGKTAVTHYDDYTKIVKTFTVQEGDVQPTTFYVYRRNEAGFTVSFKDFKLEKGNNPTDWSPAPEDQISDWLTTDVNSFSFIKNKPTLLSQFTDDIGVATHIANKANPHSVTKAQVGLGNVDNIQQATKVEFMTQKALFDTMFRKTPTNEIEAKLSLYTLGGLSAYGFSDEGSSGGGGGIVNILSDWAIYDASKEGWALGAGLGKGLYDNKADKTDPRFTDARTPLAHTHVISDITGLQGALNSKTNQTFSDGLNDRLTNVESGSATTVNTTGTGDLLASASKVGNNINFIKGNQSWGNLSGKPSTFAPSAHNHPISDITNLQTTLANKLETSIFNTHNTDNIRHITGVERTKWDGVVTDFAELEIGGRNLIVLQNVVDKNGRLTTVTNSTRYIFSNVGYYTTDKIYVNEGDEVVLSSYQITSSYISLGYFDEDDIYILRPISRLNSEVKSYVLTIPSGVAYVRVSFLGSDSNYFKLEKGNKPTDWSPAPEDQVSDWLTTDVNSFSFIKNKPTLLSQFTDDIGVATHIANKANPHSVTKAQVGLGNVDNIQQATKVEFMTQKALFDTMFRKTPTNEIEAKLSLYTLGGLSAYGFSDEGSSGGGGGIVNILSDWAIYDASKEGWALGAGLGKGLYDNKADKTDPRFTDARTPLAHTHVISDITGLQGALNSKTNQTFSDGLNDRLTNVESGSATTVNTTGTGDLLASASKVGNNINFIKGNQSWGNLSGKPSTFAPSAHNHPISDITNLQTTLANKLETSIFNTHNTDNIRHITGVERTKWDGVVTDFAELEIGGRNLIVLQNVVDKNGRLTTVTNSTRYIFSNVGYYTTDKIYVNEGDEVVLSSYQITSSYISLGYFDEDDIYILRPISRLNSEVKSYVLTIPSGVAYVRVSFLGSDSNYFKLEKGNKPTDWSPAPEDQVSDWLTTDVNSFSFIKNKPTLLSQFTDNIGVATHIANKANPHSVTTAQIGAVDLTTNQNIGGVKSFTSNAKFTTIEASGTLTALGGNSTNWNSAFAHISVKTNPHDVTKAQVGLGNVTNESKATMFANPTFTGTTKVTILELDSNWKFIKVGDNIELQFDGVTKQIMTNNGDIIATAGVTAYQ